MKAIRFKLNLLPYTAGEVAGFADHEADRLVKAGYAGFVEDEKPAPAQVEDEKPKAAAKHGKGAAA